MSIERSSIICNNPDCGKEYTPKSHNGKYCSAPCRTIIMNKKILEKYYLKRDRKKSTERFVCTTNGCETILSKYNNDVICEYHKKVKFHKKMRSLGWSEEQIEDKYADLL